MLSCTVTELSLSEPRIFDSSTCFFASSPKLSRISNIGDNEISGGYFAAEKGPFTYGAQQLYGCDSSARAIRMMQQAVKQQQHMLKNLRTRKEQSASNTGKYTYGQDSDITIEEPDLAFSWGDNVIEMTTQKQKYEQDFFSDIDFYNNIPSDAMRELMMAEVTDDYEDYFSP